MQMSGFRPFEWQRIATPQPSGGDQIHPPFWDEIRFATPPRLGSADALHALFCLDHEKPGRAEMSK